MTYTPGKGGAVQVSVPPFLTAVFTLTCATGRSLTVYSDAARTASVSMPANVTGSELFYVAEDDDYTFSATVDGIECAVSGSTVGSFTSRISNDTTLSVGVDRETAELGNLGAGGITQAEADAAYVPPAGKTTSSSVAVAPSGSVNVKDYGAKGDGTTDDTTAIQAAINAQIAPVFFPAGVYICQPLTLPPGTVLAGVNSQGYYNATLTVPNSALQSVLKLKTGSTGALISPNDGGTNLATEVIIRDLALNCNGITQPAINLPDSGTSISRFWLIDHCYAFNCGGGSGYTIYIGNQNTGCTMRDTVVFNGTSGSRGGYSGVGWYGSDGTMDNCFIGYCTNVGLQLIGGANDYTFQMRGGGVFTCGTGAVGGAGGAVFTNVSFDHNTQDGVYIGNGPVTFVGCTFHTNSTASNGANSNITIAGNSITVSLLGCRAAPLDTGSNNPKYMINVTGTGVILNQHGNTNEGVAFTTGWTNYAGTTTEPGAGVSGISAGSAVTLTPSGGTGVVTVNAKGLLAAVQYAPGTYAGKSTGSSTAAAIDSTNLTVSFTAPPSGNVLVRLTASYRLPSGVNGYFVMMAHSGGAKQGNAVEMGFGDTATSEGVASVPILITGLTPGAALQWDWGYFANGSSLYLDIMGSTGVPSTSYAGPATIEIWAA